MSRSISRSLAAAVLCALPAAGINPPAFPGAEGFGAGATGGRGGLVLAVTRLDDSGPGSLRAAIEAPGPRVIVFRTGGLIRLTSNLKVLHGDLTIAGQTAPGDGICLAGASLIVCAPNVIVRGLRIRPGDDPAGPEPDARDALTISATFATQPVRDVIVDHCSFTWSIDENASVWWSEGRPEVTDVTIQWSIIAEPLHRSLHTKGAHGMGLLIGPGGNVSVHHNLFANNNHRNPLIAGGTVTEIVGNVVYNWGGGGIEFGGPETGRHLSILVGNTFIPGSNTRRYPDGRPGAGVHIANQDPPATFGTRDIRDMAAFLAAIRDDVATPEKRPGDRILALLPAESRQVYADAERTAATRLREGARHFMLVGLNRIIDSKEFYQPEFFEGIAFGDHLTALLANGTAGGSAVANRLLLEAAYPGLIRSFADKRPFHPETRIYMRGNIDATYRPTDDLDEWAHATGDNRDYRPCRAEIRSAMPPFATRVTTRAEAARLVQTAAGAIVPRRDPVDTRIVGDFIARRGRIVDSVAQVGGYPDYRPGIPPTDSDGDGIPDEWEIARGLNPHDPSDAQADRTGDGYTNIEEYINGLIPAPAP